LSPRSVVGMLLRRAISRMNEAALELDAPPTAMSEGCSGTLIWRGNTSLLVAMAISYINLLYVSTQLLWWYAVTRAMRVESGQLVAHELPLSVATERGDAGRAEHLQQQHAQPVAHGRQGQGRRQLLPPVGFTDQAPDRDQ